MPSRRGHVYCCDVATCDWEGEIPGCGEFCQKPSLTGDGTICLYYMPGRIRDVAFSTAPLKAKETHQQDSAQLGRCDYMQEQPRRNLGVLCDHSLTSFGRSGRTKPRQKSVKPSTHGSREGIVTCSNKR